MADNVTREELYSAIDRQSLYLEKILTAGFDGIKQRQDTANGRTNKLEDRMSAAEQIQAILMDRAEKAETKATEASYSVASVESKLGNNKWWASAIVGAGYVIFEVIKKALAG